MEQATIAKTAVEDAQRDLRRRREESAEVHTPRFFELANGRWSPKLRYEIKLSIFERKEKRLIGYLFLYRVPEESEEATKAVQEWIFPSH